MQQALVSMLFSKYPAALFVWTKNTVIWMCACYALTLPRPRNPLRSGKVRNMLQSDFRELRQAQTDNLIYVKEDLIIPHSVSFYDLIVNKVFLCVP